MEGLIVFVFLIIITWAVGRSIERKHYQRLAAREQALQGFLATDVRTFPQGVPSGPAPTLVAGSCVIGSDYFRRVMSSLRKIFGGELKSYISLMDRARREAVARMLEDARDQGFNAVCNIRIETSNISGAAESSKNVSAMVEVYAYGTGYTTM